MATSLLVQAKLPPKFWAEALAAAVYIRIQCPTSASITGPVPPFAAFPDIKKNQYSHLHPFGCLCYVLVPKLRTRTYLHMRLRLVSLIGPAWQIHRSATVKRRRRRHHQQRSLE